LGIVAGGLASPPYGAGRIRQKGEPLHPVRGRDRSSAGVARATSRDGARYAVRQKPHGYGAIPLNRIQSMRAHGPGAD